MQVGFKIGAVKNERNKFWRIILQKLQLIKIYKDIANLTAYHEKYFDVEPDFLIGTIVVDSEQGR